jgi:hypothetical protein
VVYHAPVAPQSAVLGALACALIKEVGGDNTSKVVVGGDFNLTTQGQFKALSECYENLNMAGGTTSTLSTAEFGYMRTQVKFQQPFRKPPQLVAEDSTYEHPRDVFFFRHSFEEPWFNVFNVTAELMDADRPISKAIFNDKIIAEAVLGAIDGADGMDDAYRLPEIVRDDVNLIAQIKAPFVGTPKAFATSLAATVFYRCFISDHLPLLFAIR